MTDELTIKDLKTRKLELENLILAELIEFQNKYNVGVDLRTYTTRFDEGERLLHVEIEVKI